MKSLIDFYFDFSSPYGYLASTRIDALAERYEREVAWHPILLGVVFKTTGGMPLPSIPLKGQYALHDFLRSAKFHGVEFSLPSPFPIATQTPARATVWLQDSDAARAKDLAKALFHAYFVAGSDISQPDNTVAVATRLGLDADAVRAALADPAIKDKLKAENELALERGVFGSPFVVVDGEPFWGVDRFDQIEKWLATGGW